MELIILLWVRTSILSKDYNPKNHMHSDSKKRRPFLTQLYGSYVSIRRKIDFLRSKYGLGKSDETDTRGIQKCF